MVLLTCDATRSAAADGSDSWLSRFIIAKNKTNS